MVDFNQLVKVNITSINRQHYLEKGYSGEPKTTIYVKLKDVYDQFNGIIEVICDDTNQLSYITYKYYLYLLSMFGEEILEEYIPDSLCDNYKVNEYYHLAKMYCQRHGYELLSGIEDFANSHSKIKFKCPFHGEETKTLYEMKKDSECFDCSRGGRWKTESEEDKKRESVDYIKKYSTNVNQEDINY